jgi:hypothetical protein
MIIIRNYITFMGTIWKQAPRNGIFCYYFHPMKIKSLDKINNILFWFFSFKAVTIA